MLTEQIELLGKGLYGKVGIPDVLTLKSIPTVTELDYVGSEDFDQTMINKILPESIEEKIDFGQLLAIDYYWICRGLRLLSYGPYYTTNVILCADCLQNTHGEIRVDLRTVGCRVPPPGFTNEVVLDSSEFLDFKKNLTISLLTINEQLTKDKDKLFEDKQKQVMNQSFANVCYQIKKVDGQPVTPMDNESMIRKEMSPGDYRILKELVHEKLNYGLQAGGRTTCPKCGSSNAAFMALVDDRFFRPSVGDLRKWKADRKLLGEGKDSDGGTASNV